jgi:glycosyltransferase involved in cell wall biosynthesis
MLSEKLTVVIPCKNEEKYIGALLDDLAFQYRIQGTKVIIADANSTDATLQVIEAKKKEHPNLSIQMTQGGKVSVARNNGAVLAQTPYILFIDADTRLFSPSTLVWTLLEMEAYGYKLLTCRLKCYEGSILDKALYSLYNYIHALLIKFYPFAIGTYFMVRTEDFNKFGRFNTESDTCEDFLFSQNFKKEEFCFHSHYVGQDNRRLKKMGRLGMAKYLLKNLYSFYKKTPGHFNKDVGYW